MNDLNRPVATRGDGVPVEPGDAALPVIKELSPGRLLTIGTACYLSRYGLFVTAAHVIGDLRDDTGALGPSYLLHLAADMKIHLRRIRSAAMSTSADIALGQAENYVERFPQNPLMNLRAQLSWSVPASASWVGTYAYPENRVMDFTEPDAPREVRGDFFTGKFLRYVEASEHPAVPYPHYETTIQLKSGASGGPVFDDRGRVIGVNCRGWDFGDQYEGDHLSLIVPVSHLMSMAAPALQLPPGSWEEAQVPLIRRSEQLTVAELVAYGHIKVD